MDSRMVIRSQYLASLEMLKQAMVKCPAVLWNQPEDKTRFWQIAYHTLFYPISTCKRNAKNFNPGRSITKDGNDGQATSRVTVQLKSLEYLALCQQQVVEKTADLDLEGESGFHWLPFNKLELQIYNIRHLQQHTGELMERLGTRAQIDSRLGLAET